MPTRKCLKKEKYCKSTNETGERVGRKKCKNWGIGRKCWLLRADITRSRQHCSSSWWSFMALNICVMNLRSAGVFSGAVGKFIQEVS